MFENSRQQVVHGRFTITTGQRAALATLRMVFAGHRPVPRGAHLLLAGVGAHDDHVHVLLARQPQDFPVRVADRGQD